MLSAWMIANLLLALFVDAEVDHSGVLSSCFDLQHWTGYSPQDKPGWQPSCTRRPYSTLNELLSDCTVIALMLQMLWLIKTSINVL